MTAELAALFRKHGPNPLWFTKKDGLWRYEDPYCPIANVVGRGVTKKAAFKHWLAIGPALLSPVPDDDGSEP